MPYPRSALTVALVVLGAASAGWLGARFGSSSGPAPIDEGLAMRVDALEAGATAHEPHAPAAPALRATGDADDELLARLRSIEERLDARDAQADTDDATGDDVQPDPSTPEGRLAAARAEIERATGRTFIRSVDDARTRLNLSDDQIERFAEHLETARTEWRALAELPNDEGTTLAEAGRVDLKEGGIVGLAQAVERVKRLKSERVPGRNETYGEAQRRIVDSLRRDVGAVLRPEQTDAWANAEIAGLLGGAVRPASTGAQNDDR